ncbi:MAG TPA: hypothetical protein VFW09_11875 [Solirubrobacteraceae bacterium]|nr:hypothetical protein [Solirubrobacteraceae bacterium]
MQINRVDRRRRRLVRSRGLEDLAEVLLHRLAGPRGSLAHTGDDRRRHVRT